MNDLYTIGSRKNGWKPDESQTITFIVTEDCNLRCKYCYITHKRTNKKMPLQVAKDFIDYIFSDNIKRSPAVIVEFIGGEPFLEIELIDEISDYFKTKAYIEKDDWFWNYRFSICTNGINYSNKKIQKYLEKNNEKVSVSITLDGTKEKHDLQRVFEDGKGSYETIIDNVPKWISQSYPSTKVTFASSDLVYLKDSIIDLWKLGITDISANVVYEDVWKENDDQVFEKQLIDLADYIIDNKLFDKFYCSLFDDSIGFISSQDDLDKTYCGAGKMLALGPNGNIYPCLRYKDYSLNKKDEWKFGTTNTGIDMEKVRPFMVAMTRIQSDQECLVCPVSTGCGFCQGLNYDESDSGTNFFRAKYICKMHKARVRANNYYFSRLYNKYGIERDFRGNEYQSMYFLLSDNYISFCEFENDNLNVRLLTRKQIDEGLKFSREYFYEPIFVHSASTIGLMNNNDLDRYKIKHIVSVRQEPLIPRDIQKKRDILFVFEESDLEENSIYPEINNSILNVDANNINMLYSYVSTLFKFTKRINLNVLNLNSKFDLKEYRKQLMQIKDRMIFYSLTNEIKEIDVINDYVYLERHNNCSAGDKKIFLAPDNNLYPCAAFYTVGMSTIGNLTDGIISNGERNLFNNTNHPLCNCCENYQCKNCIYVNKTSTKEVNVSPTFQCLKGSVEREVSQSLMIEQNMINEKNLKKIAHFENDPINAFFEITQNSKGYYKQN